MSKVIKALKTPEDRDLSPYTGWTREHWDEFFRILVQGVVDHARPERAEVAFEGRPSVHGPDSDRLESVSRTMLMAAPYLYRSASGRVELEGGPADLAGLYRDLLLSGTDPSSKAYWGPAVNFNQRLVEMAAVALNLFLSREKIWDKLTGSQRKQIASWLQTAIGKKLYDVNWVLFNVFINLFLRELGQDHSLEEIDRYLDRMDYWYSGDGWYRDGVHDCYDYYNAWVIQPYLLFWAWIDGDRRPDLKQRVLQRAAEFLKSYKCLFAANGAYPCYSRSMIYRFAAVSPFPVAQLLGVSPLSGGQARRICSGNVKFFLSAGALTPGMYLSQGHLGEYLPIVEAYSGPGSPYWAAKAFWCFLLGPDDPFWTEREEPSEAEKGDFSVAVPSAGMIIRGHRKSGMTELINQRSKHHVKKKYSNFSYSSCHGYEITERNGTYFYDNSFCLTRDDRTFIQRTACHHLVTVKEFSAGFQTLPEDEEVRVHTNIILKDNFQVRVHRAYGASAYRAAEGGMSLGYHDGVKPRAVSGEGWEFVSAGTSASFIRNLSGYDTPLSARGHGGEPSGNNPCWPNSVVPGFFRSRPLSCQEVLAVMVCYDALAFDPEEAASKVKSFRVLEKGGVLIAFQDGVKVFTQVGTPQYAALALNGIEIAGDMLYARAEADGSRVYIVMPDGNERFLGANQVNLLPED